MSDLMKISKVRMELLHADGRTDGQTYMTKLKVVFFSSQFYERA